MMLVMVAHLSGARSGSVVKSVKERERQRKGGAHYMPKH